MASREFEHFYQLLVANAFSSDMSIKEVRAEFERRMAAYPPAPDIRFEPFTIGQIPACWVFAPEASREKIILFFFGGAYSAGSIHSHRDLMARLSRRTGAAVLGINYRLAPENPFPAALEDALTSYRWLLHHPYPPSHIALAGISAGGGLAASLLLRLKLEDAPLPKAAVLFCPWLDLTLKSKSIKTNAGKDLLKEDRLAASAQFYANGKDVKDPFISPLYADLRNLPPLFIQSGARDLLHEEALVFAEKGKKSGVHIELDSWPEMMHIWQMFAAKIPEGQEAIERAGDFLSRAFRLS